MKRARRGILWVGLAAWLCVGMGAADAAAAPRPRIAVAVFAYTDSSGEPGPQARAHRSEVLALQRALVRRLPVEADVSASGTDCLDRCARAAGATLLLRGGVHKMSTLVQWAVAQLVDVRTGRVILRRLYTFRGDDRLAWAHAGAFLARDLGEGMRHAGLAGKIPLAVFPFEMDDFSADAGYGVANPVQKGQLQAATEAVRAALRASGRFVLLTGTGTARDARAVGAMVDCGGCDAPVARRLGASEALTGVIQRISQTEYQVRLTVRDAASGAVLLQADSGLRMGAAYAWGRGAVTLARALLDLS